MIRAPHVQQALDSDPLLKTLFQSDSAASILQEKAESANQHVSPFSFQDMKGALNDCSPSASTSQPREFNFGPAPAFGNPTQSSIFTFGAPTQTPSFPFSSPSPSVGLLPSSTVPSFGSPSLSSGLSFTPPSSTSTLPFSSPAMNTASSTVSEHSAEVRALLAYLDNVRMCMLCLFQTFRCRLRMRVQLNACSAIVRWRLA